MTTTRTNNGHKPIPFSNAIATDAHKTLLALRKEMEIEEERRQQQLKQGMHEDAYQVARAAYHSVRDRRRMFERTIQDKSPSFYAPEAKSIGDAEQAYIDQNQRNGNYLLAFSYGDYGFPQFDKSAMREVILHEGEQLVYFISGRVDSKGLLTKRSTYKGSDKIGDSTTSRPQFL